MFKSKPKKLILLTFSFFFIFIIVIPVIFTLPYISSIFCVNNNNQILSSILSHPIRLINILVFYYSAAAYCGSLLLTSDMLINAFLFIFLPPLLVSLLLGFLCIKTFPLQANSKNKTKQKLYLTCFFGVIIFLAIRLIKNHFGSPFVLIWGNDPLIMFIQQYTFSQAVFYASLYGPSALIDKTNSQIFTEAMYISIALDAFVSIIIGYILAFVPQRINNKNSKAKKSYH